MSEVTDVFATGRENQLSVLSCQSSVKPKSFAGEQVSRERTGLVYRRACTSEQRSTMQQVYPPRAPTLDALSGEVSLLFTTGELSSQLSGVRSQSKIMLTPDYRLLTPASTTPSRRPPGATCVPLPPGPSAHPSRPRSACTRQASRRSRRRPYDTRRRPSPRCGHRS